MAGRSVAIVTGASRGIGAAIATALGTAGYAVALFAREATAAVGVAESVGRAGGTAWSASVDVTDAEAVHASVDQVVRERGGVDLLVNSAGLIEPEAPLWQADVEQWWQVVTTNVRGPFLLAHAVVPHMVAAGAGRIVNLNSGAGNRERGDLTAYCASKSALARVTGGLHEAGWALGIRAFDISPGVVRTDMTRSMSSHVGRTEWTDMRKVTDLVLGLASGELDAWSGRHVRAGIDTVESLRARAASGLDDDARRLRLHPWGDDDPLSPAPPARACHHPHDRGCG